VIQARTAPHIVRWFLRTSGYGGITLPPWGVFILAERINETALIRHEQRQVLREACCRTHRRARARRRPMTWARWRERVVKETMNNGVNFAPCERWVRAHQTFGA